MNKIKAFAKKVGSFFKKSADKLVLMAAAPIAPLAADATTGVDVDSWITSITGLFGDFSVANLIKIIGAGLAICIPFVIFWFAYRYISKKANKGMKKGGM